MFFGVHVIKRRSDWPESDWPELFGMARTKDSAQRYQTILSAAILLAEVVGWERDYTLSHYLLDFSLAGLDPFRYCASKEVKDPVPKSYNRLPNAVIG